MANSESRIRGSAELQVDDQELEARLLITKSENGPEWSAQSLKEYLSREGIIAGFTDDSLDAALQKAAAASEIEVEVVVAEGSPPDEPQPELATTEKLPIPEDLEETASAMLENAGPPEIVVHKTQTVERSKVIERGRALPFLAKKRETVTVREKEKVAEPIYVDPTVEWTGYAEEGQLLATVTPQPPSRSGVNVYGALLQPKRLAYPLFYAGGGVTRRKESLLAERSGFVRRGSNWIDIVPFADHEWHLGHSKDYATCLLTFHPGHGNADPPRGTEIRKAALHKGYPYERLLSADDIESLVADAVENDSALVEQPITVNRDSEFSIHVSEDKLNALLNIYKGLGRGKPLVLRELGRAIQKSGLKRLDLDRIKADIMAFYNSIDADLTGYVLAEGEEPAPGPEREIEWNVHFLPEKEVERLHPARIPGAEPSDEELATLETAGSENHLPHSAFPTDHVSLMAHVDEQQRIATIPPPAAGESGVDVYGQTIAAAQSPEPSLRCYEGVRREKNSIISTRAGLFECAVTDGVQHLRVRLHRDARVFVELSDDRMKAYLSLDPGEGSGKPISAAEVQAAVSEAGIVYGIHQEVLDQAIAEAAEGATIDRVRFAEGTPPENEDTPRVEYLIRMASGQPLTVRSDGSIDFRNQDKLTSVEAEQHIAKVLAPEHQPKDGQDVTGREIPAQRISGGGLGAGDNVRTETMDGAQVLIAEIAGEVKIEQQLVSVVTQHTVRGDVDLSTGNIKFPGSVQISGNVCTGFYVLSGGDIRVGEGVETALLSADGNVIVQQGIKGGGKGAIRSKQNIAAAFAERATLLCVGDIVLKNSCVHSRVKCNGKLTLKAKNGSIVGGEVRARKGLSVANLGSQSGTHTHISFGQDYLIADQIEKEQQALDKLKASIAGLDLEMHKREKAGQVSELEQLRRQKKQQLKIIDKRSLRLFTLREKFEHHYTSHVDIHGTVHPGVVVESHGRQHEFREPKNKVRISFSLETGHIQIEPLAQADQQE